MKRKIITAITILSLLTVIYGYLHLPDYYILNSMSFGTQDTRDTQLKVIVYKCWGINDMIREIESEHNRFNGVPTTLEIKLYYPSYFLQGDSKPFKTVTLRYKKKE